MHGVYLSALCQHVSRFGFLDGRMSDIRIRAFGRVYHLHRLFLVQASFFNGLFCAGFAEGRDGISDITSSLRGRRAGAPPSSALDADADAEEYADDEDDGILDLPFEDPNITRPAFEYCIAHLYGAAPELVLPEWASPQPSQPLSSAFVMPVSNLIGPVAQSASSIANQDGSASTPLTASSASGNQHPATPRFLLSLLATSIYLGIPSVTTHVITLILYSITPFTIMHYLRFATGQTILGASEAMQRSVMHEIALSAPVSDRHPEAGPSARPDVWDWELEGPVRGLEHLGRIQRRRPQRRAPRKPSAAAAATNTAQATPRESRGGTGRASSPHSALLQQTKNLSLNDDDTSTGPNSNDGHHITAPASPQLQTITHLTGKPESLSTSLSLGTSPGSRQEKDGKRAGDAHDGRNDSTPQQQEDLKAADGRDSRTSQISEDSLAATEYQTDDAEFSSRAPSRTFPIRPPLLGEGAPETGRIFHQAFQAPAGATAGGGGIANAAKKQSPPSAYKPSFGGAQASAPSGTSPRFNASMNASAAAAVALSPPLTRPAKRSQFYYGSWGEKMGEACACWLVRFGADILEEEIGADEQRAAETEGWMLARAQSQSYADSRAQGARQRGADGVQQQQQQQQPAPWQLALQIPSGEVSNSIYGVAGLAPSPGPFGKNTVIPASHSTPRAGSSSRRWTAGADGYDSDGGQSASMLLGRDGGGGGGAMGPGASALLDAPDEDRFIQTYMLPYGQLPERDQLARPPPLLVWSLGHMSSDWVREIISSDSFFVRSEWERFVFATRVVELRRRQKLRRLAVLKVCGYLDDDEEIESSDEDSDRRPDFDEASNASTSAASLGEQWRRLTGHGASSGADGDDDEDGDDEEDDDEFAIGHSYRHTSRRLSGGGRMPKSKGKSGVRNPRRDRSPVSRRTSFVSNNNNNSPADFQRSVKGTPDSQHSKRSHAHSGGRRGCDLRKGQGKATIGSMGLPRDTDEHEYEEMFKKGVYYMHMSFDELNRISSMVSSMTGATFVPLSVLQSALWAGSELKNHILSGGTLSQPNASVPDPPPQLPNMFPTIVDHGAGDDTHAGGPIGAEQGGGAGQNGQGMVNSATLPPIKDLGISSTLTEFRQAAEAMMKGNSSFHGPGKLFDPNLSYLMAGQDQARPPITLGGHMASPLMLGAASKPGALLGKRYFPVLTDSTIRLGGSTTPIFGSGGAGASGGTSADKSALPDQSMQAPPSPATRASGAMGVAAAKDPLAFTISSTLQGSGSNNGNQNATGTLAANVAAALEGGHASTSRGRAARYFGISNCVRTGRELAADATLLEKAQARAAEELSEESWSLSSSEAGDAGEDKGTESGPGVGDAGAGSGGAGAGGAGLSSRKRRNQELIRRELENSRWTGYEPMRIGAEFYGVDTLADKQRLYSPTFFYAGSLWNLYVQTTKKSKGLQLGVYLHRQNPHDPLPVVTLPHISVPRLVRRPDDTPIERSTTPIHAPREVVRPSTAPTSHPRAGTSSAHRHNQTAAGGQVPSLYLNIPSTSAGTSSGPSITSIIASSSTSSVPMTMIHPSTTSLTGAVLSGSPGARGGAGPLAASSAGMATAGTQSIVAHTQAPIPGSTLGAAGAAGGSFLQAVNARYQEVAAADASLGIDASLGGGGSASRGGDGQGGNGGGGGSAAGGAHPLSRDGSNANMGGGGGGPAGSGGVAGGTVTAPAPQVPYTDPRRELRAFFSIHCPSPLGSSLTRFSSGPDRFALTQSWGWKSSSLLMTMYLPERKLTEAKTEAHRSFRCVCTLSLGP